MNVLYGLLQPDEGEILVDGAPVTHQGPRATPSRPASAWCTSTSCSCPSSPSPRTSCSAPSRPRGGFIDHATAVKLVREVSQRYGLPLDPDAIIEDLPIGIQQRVEIVKALTRDVDLLILDEPTAVLTPQETDELLEVMRGLKAAGKSIVFITHKLREVKAVADRITVIRRGRTVGTAEPTAPESELAELMVGRSVVLEVPKEDAVPGEPVLEVAGLVVADDRSTARSTAWTWWYAPERCSASRACRATGRPSWSSRSWGCAPRWPARSACPARRSPAGTPARCCGRGRGLRARGPQRRRPGQGVLRRREPGARPATTSKPFGGRFALDLDGHRRVGRRPRRSPSSTSAPSRRSSRSARCPAATSRRSSSRARCRGR